MRPSLREPGLHREQRPARLYGQACSHRGFREPISLAGVVAHRQTTHTHLTFCPESLSSDTTIAPALPALRDIDVALVGNGAIGTASALILSELALDGRVIACDPGRYTPENHETYSAGNARDVQSKTRKVDLAGDLLQRAGYTVETVFGTSAELIRRVDAGRLRAPRVVLAGLDSIEARRETQSLWPDHLIDAATGDTAAGLCHALPEGPCVRCFFPERHNGPSPLEELARETGLSWGRLHLPDATGDGRQDPCKSSRQLRRASLNRALR
jgi:hypothetical protein